MANKRASRRTAQEVGDRIRSERDRIQKEVREAVERSSVYRATEKRISTLEKNLEKSFQTFLKNLNIPTRKEIQRLEKKIDKLTKDLAKAQGKATKKKAAKKKAKRKTAKKA